MPIFAQGYRAYTGPVRRGSRALAIAWESIRPRMRWWVWLLLFLFLWWPYLIFGGMTYMVLFMGIKMGKGLPMPDVVFENLRSQPGAMFLAGMTTNDGRGFWDLLNLAFAATGPVVLPAIACAGILAADRNTHALQIYLARPVSRLDYLVGKVLAVSAFSALLLGLPSLALWAECAALQPGLDWIAATWWVPFSIVAASLVYTMWAAGLVLLASSILSRPVLIGAVVIFIYLFLLGFGEALGRAVDKAWFAVVPHYAIGAVTAPLFGLRTPDWLPMHYCVLTAFGFPALCFFVVVRRIRAVEVVT